MSIVDRFNNKHILIWGYGREGKSTEHFLNTFCSTKSISIFEGKQEDIDESQFDYIIKSPGIYVDAYSDKYTSQTELFLEQFRSQTIGITGTKGKSTTSAMMYSVLNASLERDVILVGNIGVPCLDYYSQITPDTVIVFEMSCHQLAHTAYSPHVAVFLNLYEDHLDYYGTLERYFAAKRNITAYQTEQDFFFCGDNVPAINTLAHKEVISYSSPLTFNMKLLGDHNQFNARFVYAVSTNVFGCDEEKVKSSIADFCGLAHRMEFVANVEGVDYYNDSISTIPEATIKAIGSISNVKTILIGGMDRHIHYDILVDFIRQHPAYNYIFSYESGKRIYMELQDQQNCFYKEALSEAVALAKEITCAGEACLFSPAAASYGYFKNFEERGEYYSKIVRSGIKEGE